jgi:hypothetical protein
LSPLWFRGIPFLAILRNNRAELALVVDDGHVGRIVAGGALTNGSAEVLETSTHGEVVQLGRHSGGRKKRRQERLGVHFENDDENGGRFETVGPVQRNLPEVANRESPEGAP